MSTDWAELHNRKNRRPRPIIIKFLSYLNRRKIWLHKKVLKGTSYLITESLTRRNADLYDKCKKIVGKTNTWTVDGRVFVILPNQKKLIVKNDSDVGRVERELKINDGERAEVKRRPAFYALRSTSSQPS